MQKRMDLPNYVSNILSSLNDHGFQAFVVGGCVRDALLGIEPSDYDITTNALPDQVETIFPIRFRRERNMEPLRF